MRDSRPVIVPDSMTDPRCDRDADGACRGFAARSSCRWSAIWYWELFKLLRISLSIPLESTCAHSKPLASHTARALTGLRQLEEIRRLNQTQELHAQELARSELALREQTRILQSVLDCMGDGVVVADSNAKFLVFNPAAARILGHGQNRRESRRSGRVIMRFSCPKRTTPYPADDLPLVRAIRGESVDQAELYIAYPSRENGTWIWSLADRFATSMARSRVESSFFTTSPCGRKRNERLAAQYETTRVLAEADSPAESIEKILETICEMSRLGSGSVLEGRFAAQRLRCAAVWRRPGVQAIGT